MLEELKKTVKEIGLFKDRYLVSCFMMNNEWRVDYYSPKEHVIYTYFKVDNKLKEQKDEIFQKEKKLLEKLDLEKVKIHYLEALEKVEVESDKYIIILQVIDNEVVWNVTILTTEFRIYNAKISAETGKKLSEEECNMLDFKKGLGTS